MIIHSTVAFLRVLTVLMLLIPGAIQAHTVGPDDGPASASQDVGTPHLVVLVPANLRAGPGINYEVIGGARAGERLPLLGRSTSEDWWQVQTKNGTAWIFAALGQAIGPIDRVAIVDNVRSSANAVGTTLSPSDAEARQPASVAETTPVTGTVTVTTTSAAAQTVADTVVLGPDTSYPVRARRFVGWGYEIVDASTQYDLVLNRDVFGQVAHDFWGDKLYKAHPHGLRISLVDFNAPAECDFACKSCPGQPTMQRPVTPLQTVKDWRGQCHTNTYQEGYGDGAGSMIWVGCAHYYSQRPDDGFAVLYDPQECFIAIQSAGEHLDDLLVSATITAYNFWTVDTPWGATPEFDKVPFTPLMGKAYREGDQWRWRDQFLGVISTQR